MTTRIRFFGVAAYEIITGSGQHVLIDPFLDENPGSPVKVDDLERVDLVLVTHGAFDHLGDTEKIARRTGALVLCGGEIKAYLMAKGIPADQIQAIVWGIAVEIAGVRVQPVESHHWSQVQMPDGSFASGVPMGFIVYADPDVRFYHYGDTALFSDLKLIGERYRPTVGCVGITQPAELMPRIGGPGRMLTGEMSPQEGLLAAQWLGLSTVLPCHYIDPSCADVRAFRQLADEARSRGENIPEVVVMAPGDEITL